MIRPQHFSSVSLSTFCQRHIFVDFTKERKYEALAAMKQINHLLFDAFKVDTQIQCIVQCSKDVRCVGVNTWWNSNGDNQRLCQLLSFQPVIEEGNLVAASDSKIMYWTSWG